MSDLSPDHTTILALAKRCFDAESGKAWKFDAAAAIEVHGAACDALWDELRRQVEIADGKIPVIEHPSVKQIAFARRMRSELIARLQDITSAAIDDIITGIPFDD